jgi:hypothetical protein
MSTRSVRQIIALAFTLSLSGIASARQPASLVKLQQAAAASPSAKSSGGYRDLEWRFGPVASRNPMVVAAAGGYRDINTRFGVSPQLVRTAATTTPARWR